MAIRSRLLSGDFPVSLTRKIDQTVGEVPFLRVTVRLHPLCESTFYRKLERAR